MTTRSFWRYIRLYPPVACRILARTYGRTPRSLSTSEIAQASALSEDTVDVLSACSTWNTINLKLAERFMRACHMDPCSGKDMRRARQFIKAGLLRPSKHSYLRRSPEWEMTLKPLYEIWVKSVRGSNTA